MRLGALPRSVAAQRVHQGDRVEQRHPRHLRRGDDLLTAGGAGADERVIGVGAHQHGVDGGGLTEHLVENRFDVVEFPEEDGGHVLGDLDRSREPGARPDGGDQVGPCRVQQHHRHSSYVLSRPPTCFSTVPPKTTPGNRPPENHPEQALRRHSVTHTALTGAFQGWFSVVSRSAPASAASGTW